MLIIVLGWIVEFEQASGLYGAIRLFTFIMEVFTSSFYKHINYKEKVIKS